MCSCNPNFLVSHNFNKYSSLPKKFKLFGRTYSESVWFSEKSIFFLARKNIRHLAQCAIITENPPEILHPSAIRTNVGEFLSELQARILSSEENSLPLNVVSFAKIILYDVVRLTELPDQILFSSLRFGENMENDSSINYVHLLLNIYWFYLIEHKIYKLNDSLSIFERNLNIVLHDLIDVSYRKFDRTNNQYSDISPFICSCFRQLWLIIQLYVEKLHNEQFCKDFWYYFNFNIKLSITDLIARDALKCLWLLFNIGKLQGVTAEGIDVGSHHSRVVSNYTLVNDCLRIITNTSSTGITEELLCSTLQLIAAFQFTWWKHDTSLGIQQMLWEYFYKLTFTKTEEHSFSYVQKSYDYQQLANKILQYNFTDRSHFTSYELFICLLVKYLKVNPSHWPKLKGRIYSKLSAGKLELFTNEGLHNLIILFFSISMTVHFGELMDKLQSMLNQLPSAKSERNSIFWSAYTSLISMRVQRKIPLNSVISITFIITVNSISSDNSSNFLMQIYIERFNKIIELDQELEYQEHILLNDWISRYLKWCPYADACYVWAMLRKLVEKINLVSSITRQNEWWLAVEQYVVPAIFSVLLTSDVPQEVVHVAAMIVAADPQRFKVLSNHMMEEKVNVTVTSTFLKSLVGRCDSLQEESAQQKYIQVWLRIAVLSVDKTSLIKLTRQMMRLPKWSEIVGFTDQESTEDPLYAIIRIAGHRVRNSQTIFERSTIKIWFETYFGRLDSWASSVMASTEGGENTQLVLRIYTCTALMFLHCAPALYVKNKNTCLLYRLTTTLLLPSTLLVNKKPSKIILAALKSTWHIFVRGIARLGYKTDSYVERILKEMAIRYLPYMFDSCSPLLRCLDEEFENDITCFILEKICVTYLPVKPSISQFCGRALELLYEMSHKHMQRDKMLIFCKITFPHFVEHLSANTTSQRIILQIIDSFQDL